MAWRGHQHGTQGTIIPLTNHLGVVRQHTLRRPDLEWTAIGRGVGIGVRAPDWTDRCERRHLFRRIHDTAKTRYVLCNDGVTRRSEAHCCELQWKVSRIGNLPERSSMTQVLPCDV